MLHRSAGKPLLIGLGAAAILAAGAVPVLAAPPAPPVVPSPLSTDGRFITVESTLQELSEGARFTGVTVSAFVGDAPATLTTTCPDGTAPADDVCDLGKVDTATTAITYKVELTGTITEDTSVILTVTATFTPVEGEPEPAEPGRTMITFQAPEPDPTPTPTPTKTPPPPKPPSGNNDDDKDDDNSSSGSGSGSGSSSSGSGSGSSSSGSSSYTPPLPNGSFGVPQNPRLALPPPTAPNPAVAPQTAPTPQSRLQNNRTPVAQDLTFERMASTQVAWLAALLVAFSVLLTQLRLGRRRGVSARVLATTGRPAGTHRRPRRGLFSK